jgi:multidrug transporter EmrE-like cation transporter
MDDPAIVADFRTLTFVRYNAILTMTFAVTMELVGTTALKLADGVMRPMWYILVAAGYGGAFYFFSAAVRTKPMGVAYAMWSGLGIIGTGVIGAAFFRQHPSPLAIAGILVILLGIFLVNAGEAKGIGI